MSERNDLDEAPLRGVIVLDMAQFLSGPSAALRLGDLGARVIKIERPEGGDIGRRLYLSDTEIDGQSTLFHAINRNKESFAADLKTEHGRQAALKLITKADVVIQNFRPGVAKRLGVDYEAAKAVNPRIIMASISGYGEDGPWNAWPGQDLLAQAVSGAMWLNGNKDDGPVPFGLSIADMLAGHIAAEGVLAALVRRGVNGQGAHIQTSLLEAMIDFQFEVLSTHLNDGGRMPQRSAFNNAHAYLGAPYGVYATQDGYLALAMTSLTDLARLIDLPTLELVARDPEAAFSRRDEIKKLIAQRLCQNKTDCWLGLLRAADVWCAPVLTWPELLASEAMRELDMISQIAAASGRLLATTKTPMRFQGRRFSNAVAAPKVGEHTFSIIEEFGLMREE